LTFFFESNFFRLWTRTKLFSAFFLLYAVVKVQLNRTF
jgi:hypothetical protein